MGKTNDPTCVYYGWTPQNAAHLFQCPWIGDGIDRSWGMVRGSDDIHMLKRGGVEVVLCIKILGRAGTGQGGERGIWATRKLWSIFIVSI